MQAAKELKGIGGHHDLPKGAGDDALARLDKSATPRARPPPPDMRKALQKAMQEDAAVFRTGDSLKRGRARIQRDLRHPG